MAAVYEMSEITRRGLSRNHGQNRGEIQPVKNSSYCLVLVLAVTTLGVGGSPGSANHTPTQLSDVSSTITRQSSKGLSAWLCRIVL